MTVSCQVTVDVEELEFVDAGALEALHRVATGLPPDGRITLAGASSRLQRLIEIGGWQNPQLKIEPSVS